jgi:hypothetical protein
MEQVGPRASLDAQIMRSRIVRSITLMGGAIVAPLFASAHGTDFLQTKVSFSTLGNVRLEITANYGGNPMIADRDHATRILPDALQICLPSGPVPLAQLAPIRLEERTEFDPTSPLPTEAVSTAHELLTACWEWRPDCDQIQFEVPQNSKHDVMLWVIDSEKPEGIPRWMMLLGGDVTPIINVPPQVQTRSPYWILASLALILSSALAWKKIRS